jgi:hypothetical protein
MSSPALRTNPDDALPWLCVVEALAVVPTLPRLFFRTTLLASNWLFMPLDFRSTDFRVFSVVLGL